MEEDCVPNRISNDAMSSTRRKSKQNLGFSHLLAVSDNTEEVNVWDSNTFDADSFSSKSKTKKSVKLKKIEFDKKVDV